MPITLVMAAMWAAADARWDWRLSAHWRLGSLASAWLLVILSSALGSLVLPLAAFRFVLSTAQLLLNRALGRRQPLGPRPWSDWALLVVALLGSCAIAQYREATGAAYSPLLLLPVALPFSAIQVRTSLRCYRYRAEVEPAVDNVIELRPRMAKAA